MRPRGENLEYDKLRDRYDACAADLGAQVIKTGHYSNEADRLVMRVRELEAIADARMTRIEELEAALRQMKESIYWALGERDDFPPEPEPIAGKYRQRYWWRTELRKRSGLPIGGIPSALETGTKP